MWHLAYCSTLSEDGAGARHGHSAIVHDNHMWVYGGMTDLQARDDFWMWSFSKSGFLLLKENPNKPQRKMLDARLHALNVSPRRILPEMLHQLWCQPEALVLFNAFLAGKLKWSRVKGRHQVPPLHGHTASKVANTMILFGGQSGGVMQQDVWCFHFSK